MLHDIFVRLGMEKRQHKKEQRIEVMKKTMTEICLEKVMLDSRSDL